MTDQGGNGTVHDYQHGLIEERMKGRSNMPSPERLQANMRLNATLVGHLRGQHGWKYQGRGKPIKDLVTIHQGLHFGRSGGSDA